MKKAIKCADRMLPNGGRRIVRVVRQTRANIHNAGDYANKVGFAFRFAPLVRIICTMQNGTCFAGAHPVDLIG
jgi:hypothetical protein